MGAIVELVGLALTLAQTLTVIGPGALAAADYGVLERAELNRVMGRTERGLDGLAGPGVVRIGVEDCALIGYNGLLVVEGVGILNARVVDCQQANHKPLNELGISADVNLKRLGHKEAIIILYRN